MNERPPAGTGRTLVEVAASTSVRFQWDYGHAQDGVRGLFDKAKHAMWDPARDIDWSTDVEFGSARPGALGDGLLSDRMWRASGESFREDLRWHTQAWMLSQFLHGEQGALIAAARLVEAVPEVDWKLCAAAQAFDEAKHVEVFERYLREKLGTTYPVNRELESLLLSIVADSRWDVIYLGMQVLVEGVALGSFAAARMLLFEPLSRQILDFVLKDEARHVAFGVVALEAVYPTLTSAERAERLDFVYEALALLNRRFALDDVRERLGLTDAEFAVTAPFAEAFRRKSMAKLGPLLRRLSLWDDTVASLISARA